MSSAGSTNDWALITGAARRIGRALALCAADAGYDVAVHYGASVEDARATAALVEAKGRRAAVIQADLSATDDCAGLIAKAPAAPSLLVNCASVFEDDRIETLRPERWDEAMAVNLRAPVLLAQAFAAALPAGKSGLIVNILDQRVLRLNPQFFSYAVSKAALWSATQMLAQALAPRIRVAGIAPGPTLASVHQSAEIFAAEAAATPLRHGPTPEEIGQALAYLIEARSVTGQLILVDGGQHLAWQTPDVLAGDPA
jgi:NAD(P)-dependent dehydrogenase (short-subunit alcohol dehydrogenase family)